MHLWGRMQEFGIDRQCVMFKSRVIRISPSLRIYGFVLGILELFYNVCEYYFKTCYICLCCGTFV